MSIKEKLEEVKTKTKKHFRKAALSAAVMGTLGAGAVACGEANVKDNDKEKDKIEQVKTPNEKDNLFEKETFGFPYRKHADNPNEPDSLLVELKARMDVSVDTIKGPDGSVYEKARSTQEPTKAKYVAIDREDQDKDFVIESKETKLETRTRIETEIVEVTSPTTYDAEGRHPGKVEKKKIECEFPEVTMIDKWKYKVKDGEGR